MIVLTLGMVISLAVVYVLLVVRTLQRAERARVSASQAVAGALVAPAGRNPISLAEAVGHTVSVDMRRQRVLAALVRAGPFLADTAWYTGDREGRAGWIAVRLSPGPECLCALDLYFSVSGDTLQSVEDADDQFSRIDHQGAESPHPVPAGKLAGKKKLA